METMAERRDALLFPNCVGVLHRALHHSSLPLTQAFIEIDEAKVEASIRGCDFTRRPRLRAVPPPALAPHALPFPPAAAAPAHLSGVVSYNK
jgi:hypothetical protein